MWYCFIMMPTKAENFTLDTQFIIKGVSENKGKNSKITGYGSVFDNIDSYQDIMKKGCFKESIKECNQKFPIFFNHDPNKQVGVTTKAMEDDKGLFLEIDLFTKDDDLKVPKEVLALIKNSVEYGHKMGLSIGGLIKGSISGKEDDRYVENITEFDLREISITPIPANTEARVLSNKNYKQKSDMLKQCLKSFKDLNSINNVNSDLHISTHSFELLKQLKQILDNLKLANLENGLTTQQHKGEI